MIVVPCDQVFLHKRVWLLVFISGFNQLSFTSAAVYCDTTRTLRGKAQLLNQLLSLPNEIKTHPKNIQNPQLDNGQVLIYLSKCLSPVFTLYHNFLYHMLLFGDNYESVLLISDHITSSNLLYQQQFVTDNIKVKNNSNKRSVAFSGCCQMNRKS